MIFCFSDSVIYMTERQNTKHSCHPKIGEFSRDMMDEVAEFGQGAVMDSFISAGPKNYAFGVWKADGSFLHKVKIRGFSLNHTAAAKLNFRTLRKTVFNHVRLGQEDKISVVDPQITNDRGDQHDADPQRRSPTCTPSPSISGGFWTTSPLSPMEHAEKPSDTL